MPLRAAWKRQALPMLALGLVVVALAAPAGVSAQPHAAAPAEAGPRWSQVAPPDRASLGALEHDWPRLDAEQKQRWLALAARMPRMQPAERERVQQRLAEWSRMTPQQRRRARLHFQEAKQMAPAQSREAQWRAYQALTPEQRQKLAERARGEEQRPRAAPQRKQNVVPNVAGGAGPTPIPSSLVQARPGATTSLISHRPTPPLHQQAGLPKIAATPEFVDSATLLPRRGPQAAAIRRVTPGDPTPLQRP